MPHLLPCYPSCRYDLPDTATGATMQMIKAYCHVPRSSKDEEVCPLCYRTCLRRRGPVLRPVKHIRDALERTVAWTRYSRDILGLLVVLRRAANCPNEAAPMVPTTKEAQSRQLSLMW